MTLVLHHIKNTRSLRPLWLMEELGISYTLIDEGAHIGKLDKQAYRTKNPLGKLPCFFDGDVRITESTAIIQYIADVHANGALTRKPSDSDYGRYLQLLHFGEAGMGGYTSILLGHTVLLPEEQRDAKLAAWSKKEMANCLAYIESEIAGREYFLGEFSLADISIAYILFLLKITRNAEAFGPLTADYFKRVTAREAWKAANAK